MQYFLHAAQHMNLNPKLSTLNPVSRKKLQFPVPDEAHEASARLRKPGALGDQYGTPNPKPHLNGASGKVGSGPPIMKNQIQKTWKLGL